MSNYTKMINEEAILSWIADSLHLGRNSHGSRPIKVNWMRKTVESLNLNDALTLAKILDIKQPSGKPLHFQNLDQEFLLEADGSPLETNMMNGMANANE
tara:strand:- start:412 stop:708 length:297 start_codon:yes stop_codon:yes gene_type:complete